MVSANERFEFRVDEHDDGDRVDRFLARRLGEASSRSQITRWIRAGQVLIDGAPARPKTLVRVGQSVIATALPMQEASAAPEDIPIELIFEDEDVLIVNKAAGMVVHPAAGHPSGTLVNALMHHVSLPPSAETLRPGIVHRLDKDTSGLMVVAKSERAHRELVKTFQAHAIEREYVAICLGHPPVAQRFDTLHGRHPVARKKFTARVASGKQAITQIQRLELLHASALVACRLETGRTHQIRVHLSEAGTPILGDPIYGRRSPDPITQHAEEALGRLALHARVLGFAHPIHGEAMHFCAEIPSEFQHAIDILRSNHDT